jgi:hypothetical protein
MYVHLHLGQTKGMGRETGERSIRDKESLQETSQIFNSLFH